MGGNKGMWCWPRDSQANKQTPVLVTRCLWGALLMGCWRLLWLCHATNKQGRIFQLNLVAGDVAPQCWQLMSLLGSPGSRLPLGWAGASSGTVLASLLPQTFPQTPTTRCCQPGLFSQDRFYVLPKILHSREVFSLLGSVYGCPVHARLLLAAGSKTLTQAMTA